MGRPHLLLCTGALLCGSGVVSGAWGAHGLTHYLQLHNLPAVSSTWDTAVLYQLVHGLAILILGLWAHLQPSRLILLSGLLMLCGVCLFSGSLYGLTLGAPRWLGPITPLGGSLLIAAWLTVVLAAFRFDRSA